MTEDYREGKVNGRAYKGALQHEAVATFEINVTKNMVLSGNIRNGDIYGHAEKSNIIGPRDVRSAEWEKRILSDNREEYRKFIAEENLKAMFEMGERDPYIEYMVKDRFGKKVWIRETIALSRNKRTGDILGVVIIRDVTERKKIEIENTRRMDLIMGLTKDYETVCFVDLEKDTYDIYRRDERIWSKYRSAFLPRYSDTIEAFAYRGVYRQDRENFIFQLEPETVKSILSKKSGFTFSFRSGNTGAPQYYQAKGVRIGSPDKIHMLLGFANIEEERQEDLRKRKLLEDALERARHANDAKSSFLSNMSHDIRTPMNAIIGFANIAKTHIDEREKVLDSLDKIIASSNHLLRLIGNVLDMSRIESGRMEMEETWVSLREIIDEVTDIMRPEIDSRGHYYETSISKNVPEFVLCDRLRMMQLLLNLLSNAVKYTPPGGRVKLLVSKKPGAPAGYSALSFVISDTGIGMSIEFQKRMFEPFERENNSTVSKVMGSGLGMPICKGIVDSMGGSLTVDSIQGRGSVITVNLALKTEKDEDRDDRLEETGSGREKGHPAKDSGSHGLEKMAVFMRSSNTSHKKDGKRRILVVEDNELNREIAQELLIDDGYLVETADDGETAVIMIARSDRDYYDAILMDIQMPGIDGYEATRNIRKLLDWEHAKIPVIAMTANAFDEDMEKARSAGMNAYVAKPVEPQTLRKVLEEVLREDDEES